MADIIASPKERAETELREGIELLFFAYRDFIAEPDMLLETYGFGRAHHRAIHFIGGHPGLSVAELLEILEIRKQSLSRVLRQLVAEDYVEQRIGKKDGRQRLLYLTDKGNGLWGKLLALQEARFTSAFSAAGPEAVAGYKAVLAALIDPAKRQRALQLIAESKKHQAGD